MIKENILSWIYITLAIIYCLVFGTLGVVVGHPYKNVDLICKSNLVILPLSIWLFWGGCIFYISAILLGLSFVLNRDYKQNKKNKNMLIYALVIVLQLTWWVSGVMIVTEIPTCKNQYNKLWNGSLVFLTFEFIGICVMIVQSMRNLCKKHIEYIKDINEEDGSDLTSF